MKTCLSVLMVLLMVSAAHAGIGDTYSNDFESYTAYAATANNGGLWFPSGGDGSGLTDGWYNVGGDELQIIDSGGPHSGNPSGYGDSIGLTNFDATNFKTVAHALPGGTADLAGGEIVEMSILVNASNQAGAGKSYITVGDLGGDYLGISVNDNGTGESRVTSPGAEPGMSLPDTDTGYQEIKLVIYDAYDGGWEAVVSHIETWSGPVGGALTLRNTRASAYQMTVSQFVLQPNLGTTYDNVSIEITPEPTTMALLGLGGLAALRRRRA